MKWEIKGYSKENPNHFKQKEIILPAFEKKTDSE